MSVSKHIKPQNIDEYIDGREAFMRPKLHQIRKLIRKTAPESEELISYSMPAFKHHGILVYFAAFENHLGFYPMRDVMSYFKDEIEPYQSGMASLHFYWDKPLPVKLITQIVKYRLLCNLEKKMAKESSKKKK